MMDDGNINEDESSSTDITLIFLLVVSGVLVAVDMMEIYSILQNWRYSLLVISPIFENCLKWELYTKSIFGIFSTLAALSALILSFGLLLNTEKFVNKFLDSFLYYNWLLFGPYMLSFSIIGIFHWNQVVYICDKNNLNDKIIAPATVFSLLSCLIISSVLSIAKSVYQSILLLHDSIMRKPNGSVVLRKLFWWSVLRNRNENETNTV